MLFFNPSSVLALTGIFQIAASAALPIAAPTFLETRVSVTPAAEKIVASIPLLGKSFASNSNKSTFLLVSGASCLFFGNLLSSYEPPSPAKLQKICYVPMAIGATALAFFAPFTGWPLASFALLAALYAAHQQAE